MKKAKKFLAVCLSVVTMFLMFSLSGFAADQKLEVASVVFDYYVGGVAVEDYEDYITVETEGFEFLESENIPVIEAYDNTGKAITTYKSGEECNVVLRMQATEGYYLTIGWFSVNGIFSDDKIINTVDENGEEITYLEMWFTITIGVPDSVDGDKRIEELSLYVRPDSEHCVGDWEDYVLIDGYYFDFANKIVQSEPPVKVYYADNVEAGPLSSIEHFRPGQEYLIYVDVISIHNSRLPIPSFESLMVNNVETGDYTFGSYNNAFGAEINCVTVCAKVTAADYNNRVDSVSVKMKMIPGMKVSDVFESAKASCPEKVDVLCVEVYSSKTLYEYPLAENDVIELGYEYLVYVDLVAKDGYYFPLYNLESMKVDGEDTVFVSSYYFENDEGELVECNYGERYYDLRPFGGLIDFFTYCIQGIIDIFAIIRGLIFLMFI